MEIVRHPRSPGAASRGCVVSIGNFDGVHVGHQAIIRQLRGHAEEMRLPVVVVMFEPQPQEFFAPESAPPRLTSFREKCLILRQAGVDRLVCLRFTASLARLSPAEFVDRLLVTALAARCIVVGDDFRFGRDREGDYPQLTVLAGDRGFEVVCAQTCLFEGVRVSSSRVREALLAGEIRAATAMLGRTFRLIGRVVTGDQRGRELGYPTANVDLGGRTPPLRGVFAVRVRGLAGGVHDGVANVGTRPVFGGGRALLEVHLFGFDANIYGRRIEVEFVQRLRDEQRFESVRQLQEQIARDCDAARSCLGTHSAQGKG